MPPPNLPRRRRAVRIWLLTVAAMVFAMVLVGGATRLTESGLSIVEWKPVTGALPPLSEAAWQQEFAKYRQIPQYQQVNRGMSLAEFKTIFWWEWSHRLLGRLLGVAFLLPFLFFLWRGWIEPGLRGRLWGIFGLGALQGAVGWWMVASGLVDRVNVSQYRLAFHLTLACVIYAALVATAQRLAPAGRWPDAPPAPRAVRFAASALVALILAQIYLGALVAGLRAGYIYNTWPLIDGAFIPEAARLWLETPWWRNLFETVLTVQFQHRMAAYAVALAVLLQVGALLWRAPRHPALRGAVLLLAVVAGQIVLGILTLLYVVPIGLALAHQAGALAALTVAVLHRGRLQPAAHVVRAGPEAKPAMA